MTAKFAVFAGKDRRTPLANAFFSRRDVDKHGRTVAQTPISAVAQVGFPHIYFVPITSPAQTIVVDAPGFSQQPMFTIYDGDEYEVHLAHLT